MLVHITSSRDRRSLLGVPVFQTVVALCPLCGWKAEKSLLRLTSHTLATADESSCDWCKTKITTARTSRILETDLTILNRGKSIKIKTHPRYYMLARALAGFLVEWPTSCVDPLSTVHSPHIVSIVWIGICWVSQINCSCRGAISHDINNGVFEMGKVAVCCITSLWSDYLLVFYTQETIESPWLLVLRWNVPQIQHVLLRSVLDMFK